MRSRLAEVLEMLSGLSTLQLRYITGIDTSSLSEGLHLSSLVYRTVKDR